MRNPLALPLVAALIAASATAAPWPAPRVPASGGAARDALGVSSQPLAGRDAACATDLEGMSAELARAAERAQVEPLPVTHSRDHGEIAVLEDDGTFFYVNPGGQTLLDIAAVTRAFYATHGDDYDFLAVYLSTGQTQWLGSPGALAAAWLVRNATDGIGLSRYDVGTVFGSPARLGQVLTMNSLGRYPADVDASLGGGGDTFTTMDVLAHEMAHQWTAYVFVDSAGTTSNALLGRDEQHWNFFADVDGSFMEGCGWAQVGPDSFVTDAASSQFGRLDQYLMGLRTRAEMDSFFVVNAPTEFQPPGTYIPISIPAVGVGCRGRATQWRVDDIERVHGPRVPDGAVAPRSWRVGFVLLTPHGAEATPADLAELENIRTRFPLTIAQGTEGRGSVDVSLDSHPGTLVISPAPVRDQEGSSPLSMRVALRVKGGGLQLVPDPGGAILHWRLGESDAFSDLPMAPVTPDSVGVLLPAPPGGGVIQWYVTATAGGGALAAEWPAGGAAAPATVRVGPDVTPPVIRLRPLPVYSRERLPLTMLARVTDNLGLDSVWCDVGLNGAAPVRLNAAYAGGDSFTVSMGSGWSVGARVAYRFGARDRASARNVGYSNPAFDTLRVVHDWVEDFEHPVNWIHQNVLYAWRESWAIDTTRSSPAGGAAWHSGRRGGEPYDPRMDGALYLPWIYTPGPGVKLSFDEWHDLEQASAVGAWDGARLEVFNGSAWQAVEPTPGYTHVMSGGGMPFSRGSACWSGTSSGWTTRSLDLAPYAPGPVKVRLRMCADDFVGAGGWWIDRVRVHYPDEAILDVTPSTSQLSCGVPWPSPSRGELRVPLSLPRGARVTWTLHDVQGRRVATLFDGAHEGGRIELAAHAPGALAAGLYFSRIAADGHMLGTSRVVLLR